MEEHASFINSILRLKSIKRQGWLDSGVNEPECESVGSHSFGTAALSILLYYGGILPADIDITKLLILSTIHDIPEAITGDFTPRNAPPSDERSALEKNAVNDIFHGESTKVVKDMLLDFINTRGTPGETKEARFLRQVDKLDMMLQAIFYERRLGTDLGSFHARPEAYLDDPRLLDFFRSISGVLRGGSSR